MKRTGCVSISCAWPMNTIMADFVRCGMDMRMVVCVFLYRPVGWVLQC
jgi:hypothetical protein